MIWARNFRTLGQRKPSSLQAFSQIHSNKQITDSHQFKLIAQKILNENKQRSDCQVKYFEVNRLNLWVLDFQIISSTMLLSSQWPKQNLMKQLALLFRAKQQSRGKGQRTNNWNSPLGNLYMTLLFKNNLQNLNKMSMLAVNAVVQTLTKETKLNFKIKWINDIIFNNKKVGGVLVKNSTIGPFGYSQIGIGINIKESPIQLSTSLQRQCPLKVIDIDNLNLQICKEIFNNLNTNDWNVSRQYQQKLAYLDQHIFIYNQSLEKVIEEGRFLGVDQKGFAIIEGVQNPISNGRMRNSLVQ